MTAAQRSLMAAHRPLNVAAPLLLILLLVAPHSVSGFGVSSSLRRQAFWGDSNHRSSSRIYKSRRKSPARRHHPVASTSRTANGAEAEENADSSVVNGFVAKSTARTTGKEEKELDFGALERARCEIVVCGVGGGGGNAINHMIQSDIDGVSFWAINTDAQALEKSEASNRLQIGTELTRGLGAGGDPNQGARAAMESAHDLKQICEGADMVFITAGKKNTSSCSLDGSLSREQNSQLLIYSTLCCFAGMGGGTGSGAAPVLAEIAKKDCKCLTVAVVTKPFAFEGRRRMRQAEEAIAELRRHVDTYIEVSNDKLLQLVPEDTPVSEAFLMADDILRQGVVGITEIITRAGVVNVDFADVQSVMKDAGTALMGIGSGVGKDRAADAAYAAISSPLLDHPIHNARRVVFNVMGGEDLGLNEINEASEVIYENCADDANIIFGALVDPEMDDEVRITVVACDFDIDDEQPSPTRPQQSTLSVTETESRRPTPSVPKSEPEVPVEAAPVSRVQTVAEATQQSLQDEGGTQSRKGKEEEEVVVPVPLVLKKRGFRKPEEPKKGTLRRLVGKVLGR